MGLLFSDGFDSYGATADVVSQWSGGVNSPWVWVNNVGRNGGGGMQAATTGAAFLRTPIGGFNTSAAFGIAFWFKGSASPASAGLLVDFQNNINGTQGSARLATSGVLTLNNAGATVQTTGGTNICDNNWHWIELYITAGTGALTHKCYVDGIVQWNGSFTISGGGGGSNIDHVNFTSVTGITITVDDVIIFDTTSAVSPQPSDIPLGPQQITTTRPASDTATVQFTGLSSGSTHFNLVNEVAPDGDTSYVQDNTSGHKDLYNYGALGFTPAKIWAVNLKSLLKNPGPGSINFMNTITSNGTASDGASTSTPSSYQVQNTVYNQDPHTSAAWTQTNLDAATPGIKVV